MRAVVYARVSRREGDPEPQVRAVSEWCARRGWTVAEVLRDRVTGDPARRRADPPGLRRALQLLEARKAEVLAVFAADRIVRSPGALLDLIGRVRSAGAHVASLQDGGDLDTTTDAGELFTLLRGWWARVELRLIRARTVAGLAEARARGVRLGRPVVEVDLGRIEELRARGLSWREIAGETGHSATTLRRRAAPERRVEK